MLSTRLLEKPCICGKLFMQQRPMQAVCSPMCAKKKVRADKKSEREETKRRKEAVKSRAQWAREAQAAFNAWIRARDAGMACISCGRHHNGQYHAGHFLSVGAHPELRFEPLNVHLQCAPCNTHLSGNAVLFRKGLIAKHGMAVVEWLEGPHEPKKYTIDDLKQIKEKYTLMLRQLKQSEGGNHDRT